MRTVSMSKLRRLDISHTIHVIMLVIMTPYVVFTGHATSWPVFVFLLGGIYLGRRNGAGSEWIDTSAPDHSGPI